MSGGKGRRAATGLRRGRHRLKAQSRLPLPAPAGPGGQAGEPGGGWRKSLVCLSPRTPGPEDRRGNRVGDGAKIDPTADRGAPRRTTPHHQLRERPPVGYGHTTPPSPRATPGRAGAHHTTNSEGDQVRGRPPGGQGSTTPHRAHHQVRGRPPGGQGRTGPSMATRTTGSSCGAWEALAVGGEWAAMQWLQMKEMVTENAHRHPRGQLRGGAPARPPARHIPACPSACPHTRSPTRPPSQPPAVLDRRDRRTVRIGKYRAGRNVI